MTDNRTYIDDYKELWGIPMSLTESIESYFGKNYFFWMLPTVPPIDINYLERLYKEEDILKMERRPREDQYDEKKKELFQLTR